MNKPYKTTTSQIVWSCPWYNIRQDGIVTPNGTNAVYNVIQAPDAVWIIPITSDGKIMLIYTYRYTVNEWCYELPAGTPKPGQSLHQAAEAELLEEVGGTAVTLDYIGNFYTLSGICDGTAHIFLATGVTLGPTQHEPTEIIRLAPTPIVEALRMAQANEISDGPSALALLLCADKLNALKD